MKFKKLLIFFLIIVLVIITAVSGSGQEEKKKELTFGVIMRDASTDFSKLLIEGFSKQAELFGGVKLTILDSKNDSLRQLELMDDLITMKVDGFIFAGAIDQSAVTPGIEKMNEANIPIVAIDSGPVGGKIVAFVGNDDRVIGHKSGEALIRLLKEKYGEVPEGIIIAVVGDLRDSVYTLCIAGFHEVLDKYPQLTIKEGEGKWDPTDAYPITADLITRWGEKTVGVYIMYDCMAAGAIPALENSGYNTKEMIIVAPGIEEGGYPYLVEGITKAAPSQSMYASSKLVMQVLYDYINGKEAPKPGDTMEMMGVTYDVIEDPLGVGPRVVGRVPVVPWDMPVDDPSIQALQFERLKKFGSVE
jgi:ribose transport system substrate-binding protein